jgi:tungstate transport system ATP-binding protein
MNQVKMQTPKYALEVNNLSVVLGGQTILTAPSLQVIPGEVFVIIGPNGSGKTTLLLSLALLLKQASGTILYDGRPVKSGSEMLETRRRSAVVFQEPLLLNGTVRDNVTLGLRLRKISKEEIPARTEKWLRRFGIDALAGRQARTLSGGEAKRTSLARAFALQPDILFLDEPFTSLDSPTRAALMEDFEDVLRETKVTTIMVTHDRNEALGLAHRIAVLINGQVRQVGIPEQIFSHPVDEEVAKFVEVENIVNGVIVSRQGKLVEIDIRGQVIEAISDYQTGVQVNVCIRPEDITLSKNKSSSSARNSFPGIITRISISGVLSRVEIDCGFPMVALITKKSADEMELEKGKQIYASFKATAIHIIKR